MRSSYKSIEIISQFQFKHDKQLAIEKVYLCYEVSIA